MIDVVYIWRKLKKYQQRLNKAEPIEQDKEKIKTPLK